MGPVLALPLHSTPFPLSYGSLRFVKSISLRCLEEGGPLPVELFTFYFLKDHHGETFSDTRYGQSYQREDIPVANRQVVRP